MEPAAAWAVTEPAMNRDTAAALARINNDFYRRHAAEFSATRERPWAAWERVAEIVEEDAGDGPVATLDLGCGNGRLGRFLGSRWGERLDYLGVDGSEEILEIARALGGGRFARCDLLRDELPPGPFDLVAAFGLMHHLPGFANRARLLRAAADRLAPGGLLAVSFWQFGAVKRFRRRMVPWEKHNRSASTPVDTGELEEGDLLLAWGDAPGDPSGPPPVRYCHWTPPAEADRLLAGLPLEPVATFRADGKAGDLNLYRILRRR